MSLPKKPKREDYPPSQDGGTAWLMDDRNHYKAVAEFAVGALERITSGVPAMMNGSFCHVYHDGDGNEMGIEQLDPVSIVQSMDGVAYQALEAIRQTEQADQKPL